MIMRDPQSSLELIGGSVFGVPEIPRGIGELGAGDPLPHGPYRVGLTHGEDGDTPPWTVCCADGRAVAGHVPSLECAKAIADALNQVRP